MLSRPTTEQILLDCCRELMTNVLPSLTDATAQVSVIMVETVLRNTAVRAAHEVAWMRDETADIEAYARAVAAQAPGTTLETALAALAAAPRDSLHLDDVVETYCRAGNALSAALETAVASGLAPLVQRGEEILDVRSGHETEVMAGWTPTGR
ncbi:MAG TPA: hypothetical protein VGS06_02760 [Streptosporangiaceae bacterium]|nr:hypothetical protein [Streptosporangiaceae bacterium]